MASLQMLGICAMVLTRGQVVSSRFRVDQPVGAGAMGVVYSATDELLDRKVAIKLLRPDLATDQRFVARFVREAKIVAQLSLNPHVVTIYDFGNMDDGCPFLVTEFLTGHALSDELASPYRPSCSWVLDVGVQIALALTDAHERGVVHRDLKPGNVFVVRTGVVPLFVKVLDFGLSRSDALPLSWDHATQAGTLQGTPRYMSPEVISGGDARPASDIYSLGVLLYEFATGSFPFDVNSIAECLQAHVSSPPLPFPTESMRLPDAFRQVVMQMLAKGPEERPKARDCVGVLSRAAIERYVGGDSQRGSRHDAKL